MTDKPWRDPNAKRMTFDEMTSRAQYEWERAEAAEAEAIVYAEERDALKAEVERLRVAFRVNMLRFAPDVSHADIDDLLAVAAAQENTDD
jgi:hypothetical protein